jgi:hypothetical protein
MIRNISFIRVTTIEILANVSANVLVYHKLTTRVSESKLSHINDQIIKDDPLLLIVPDFFFKLFYSYHFLRDIEYNFSTQETAVANF